MGATGENDFDKVAGFNNPDLGFMKLLDVWDKKYLMQSRNHFETLFLLTKSASSVVQLIWVNIGRKKKLAHSEIDHPITGCKNGKWDEILEYEREAMRPNSTYSFLEYQARISRMSIAPGRNYQAPETSHLIISPPSLHGELFDLCDEGSNSSQKWDIHECSAHLGPCCGDGLCEVHRHEDVNRCPVDCD